MNSLWVQNLLSDKYKKGESLFNGKPKGKPNCPNWIKIYTI